MRREKIFPQYATEIIIKDNKNNKDKNNDKQRWKETYTIKGKKEAC